MNPRSYSLLLSMLMMVAAPRLIRAADPPQSAEEDQQTPVSEVARADWTPTLGMNTLMGERWDLTVEGGFGDRVSALFNLGYRF